MTFDGTFAQEIDVLDSIIVLVLLEFIFSKFPLYHDENL